MTIQQAIEGYLKYSGAKVLNVSVALIDMDGVLYDTMKYHTQAWVKLMKKNGIRCTREEFYAYEGMTGADIIKKKFKEGAGKNITDDEAHALYKVKGRYFTELGEPDVMAGALRVLQALQQASMRNVVVTGSAQQTLLDRLDTDFAGLLDTEARVTAFDAPRGKPSPEPYLKAITKAAVKPTQCIVIENAPLGVQSGHTAGCFTIGVTTGPIPERDLYKAGADICYPSMDALADALPDLLAAMKCN
ncbi:MAG: HAD-IA family hydrolase [Muribaculaceae bacterium]|nr:HAD-IA family hydrolase [Muribaculaceae bacterium]